MWIIIGLSSGLYSTRLPYRQPQAIFEGTNQQLLSVCNASCVLILTYLFFTHNAINNLSEIFTDILASYLFILLARISYSSNIANYIK